MPASRSHGHVLFWTAECYDGRENTHLFQQLQVPSFLGRSDPDTQSRVVRNRQRMFGPLPWHGNMRLSVGLFDVRSSSGYKAYMSRVAQLGGLAGRAYFGQAFGAVDRLLRETFSGSAEESDTFELIVGCEERLEGSSATAACTGTRVLLLGRDNFFQDGEYRIENDRLFERRGKGFRPVTRHAYIIYDLAESQERDDWLSIPAIRAVWDEVVALYTDNAPAERIEEMVDRFGRICSSSLDLTRAHASHITSSVREHFSELLREERDELAVAAEIHADRLESMAGLPFDISQQLREAAYDIAQRTKNFRRDNGNLENILDPSRWGRPSTAPAPSAPVKASPRVSASGTQRMAGATTPAQAPREDVFAEAMKFVAKWEGGFVDHPNDPGGRTKYGVTERVYHDYLNRIGLAPKSVEDISSQEVHDIFRSGYWVPVRGDDVQSRDLAVALFDTAVNMGPPRSVKFLQQAVNDVMEQAGLDDRLSVDGQFGNLTLAAVENVIVAGNGFELALGFCNLREKRYLDLVNSDPKFEVFLKGWLNRLNDLRTYVGVPPGSAQPESIGGPAIQAKFPDHEDSDLALYGAGSAPEGIKKNSALISRDEVSEFVAKVTTTRSSATIDDLISRFVRSSAKSASGIERIEDAGVWLRDVIAFEHLDKLCAYAIRSDVASDLVIKLAAQAKIELGDFREADNLIDSLIEGPDTDPKERIEALGLRGRLGKQRFVNTLKATGKVDPASRAALIAGAAAYNEIWQETRKSYHGGNALALAVLGRRNDILVPDIDIAQLVQEIPEAVEREAGTDAIGAWGWGTILDVRLATKDWKGAEEALDQFLAALSPPAIFEVRSTLRQLREVWSLDTLPHGSEGHTLFNTLNAVWQSMPGGGSVSTGAQLQSIQTTFSGPASRQVEERLEALFGGSMMVGERFLAEMNLLLKSIAMIQDRHGTPVGTGFVCSSLAFWPDEPERAVLVTNNHVINRDGKPPMPGVSCLRADEAFAEFTAFPDQVAIKVGRIRWSSYYRAHDTTILDIDLPDEIPFIRKWRKDPFDPARLENGQAIGYVTAPGHPMGRSKIEFGFTNFTLLQMENYQYPTTGTANRQAKRLHYLAATEGGSSGSPVVDLRTFELVGLHHAATTVDVPAGMAGQGNRSLLQVRQRQKTLNDRSGSRANADIPTVITVGANEGIWIGSIREAVSAFKMGIAEPQRQNRPVAVRQRRSGSGSLM
ncbi:MAG: trypsin-like peptidase domain-containing protein [Hyphomonas sp.]|nr:trypsin-like peptidase domain-containing protein [Hyphomonas sp.]